MKADLLELGKRAVACKGWRWMPGMAYTRRGKFHSVDGDFLASGGTYDETCIPDFTDPATLGCLLALVREAWRDPEAHLALGAAGWVLMSGESRVADVVYPSPAGTTEAEALVNALEGAP